MTSIIERLESHNVYCEDCDTKQLRKDAASTIRELSDALSDMLAQFTKTPSTLKDTQTRVKAHAALKNVHGEKA